MHVLHLSPLTLLTQSPNVAHHSTKNHPPKHLPSILFHHSIPSSTVRYPIFCSFYYTLPHILYLLIYATPYSTPSISSCPAFYTFYFTPLNTHKSRHPSSTNLLPALLTQPITFPNTALVPHHPNQKATPLPLHIC